MSSGDVILNQQYAHAGPIRCRYARGGPRKRGLDQIGFEHAISGWLTNPFVRGLGQRAEREVTDVVPDLSIYICGHLEK
jgi:hypothetical protein